MFLDLPALLREKTIGENPTNVMEGEVWNSLIEVEELAG